MSLEAALGAFFVVLLFLMTALGFDMSQSSFVEKCTKHQIVVVKDTVFECKVRN